MIYKKRKKNYALKDMKMVFSKMGYTIQGREVVPLPQKKEDNEETMTLLHPLKHS